MRMQQTEIVDTSLEDNSITEQLRERVIARNNDVILGGRIVVVETLGLGAHQVDIAPAKVPSGQEEETS